MKKSKNFKDHEIRGVYPDGSIYLKTGVRRRPKAYTDTTSQETDKDAYINRYIIFIDTYVNLMTKLYGDPYEAELRITY